MADRDLSLCTGRECCISASVRWPQDPLMSSPSWRRVLKTWFTTKFQLFWRRNFFWFPAQLGWPCEWRESGRAAAPPRDTLRFPPRSLAACSLRALHAHAKKCSGCIVQHAGCLTSRKMAPAFFLLSFCQREGCYGCCTQISLSAIWQRKKLPFTSKRGALTTPRRAVEWVELAHRDCTLTLNLSNRFTRTRVDETSQSESIS